MKLIVGLGNTGTRYAKTRHNAGFMVIDQIAAEYNVLFKSDAKLRASLAKFDLDGKTILLAKPATMMNASGEAIQRIMQAYRLSPKDIYVVFDDVDTPFGRMKLRQGGGSSGHQGINSTMNSIGPNFIRVKFGISLNDRAVEPSEVYVLKPFNPNEAMKLPDYIASAAKLTLELAYTGSVVADSMEL